MLRSDGRRTHHVRGDESSHNATFLLGCAYQSVTGGTVIGVGPSLTIESDRGQMRLGLCAAGSV